MTHFCSDRVTHRRCRVFVPKPKAQKAISSPPKAGCWVRFREQGRVISRECRSLDGCVVRRKTVAMLERWPCGASQSRFEESAQQSPISFRRYGTWSRPHRLSLGKRLPRLHTQDSRSRAVHFRVPAWTRLDERSV